MSDLGWKVIPDFDLYEINHCGEVRNRETLNIKRSHYNEAGTKLISLYPNLPNARPKNRSVGKLVMSLFGGECPSDRIPLIEMIDQNPRNTCIWNLRWKIPSPVMQKKARTYNERPSQSRRGNPAQLIASEVLPLWDAGMNSKDIGTRFGVSKDAINLLVRHYRKEY